MTSRPCSEMCSPISATDCSDSYLLVPFYFIFPFIFIFIIFIYFNFKNIKSCTVHCSVLYSVDRWTCDVTDRNVAMRSSFETCGRITTKSGSLKFYDTVSTANKIANSLLWNGIGGRPWCISFYKFVTLQSPCRLSSSVRVPQRLPVILWHALWPTKKLQYCKWNW